LKEAEQSEFFKKSEVTYLNDLNSKVWNFYQLTNSEYASKNNQYYNLAFQSFLKPDEIEAKYICRALIEIEQIVKEFRVKKQESEQYKEAVKAKLKNK
jgi:hypothetical protein